MTQNLKNISDSLSVYLVMGLGQHHGRSALEIAQLALEGGVTMIQLRAKNEDVRDVLEQGRQLKELCKRYKVPFIVNDRVDLAMILKADGVHVGQTDLPSDEVRRMMGPDAVIGVSAGNREEADRAMREGADYLGVGSIFATSTKKDAGAPVGVGWVKEVKSAYKIPVVGIGGINSSNAGKVIQAGADGIAVVSAILSAEDPKGAAHQLAQIVKQYKNNG